MTDRFFLKSFTSKTLKNETILSHPRVHHTMTTPGGGWWGDAPAQDRENGNDNDGVDGTSRSSTQSGNIKWAQICAHLNLELRKCLITFPIFVPSQRLIARNVCELFSFNCGVLHLNNACCIDDVSRGSLSCYKILTNN
jgi:hypothetical protein